MRGRILFVDDEVSVLYACRRALRRHGYVVEVDDDPANALERLKVGKFHVVISDYRMPRMSGLNLLRSARQVRPDVTRMMLSGHADRQAMLGSINEAEIFRFLEKPWNDQELLDAVSSAVEHCNRYLETDELLRARRAKDDLDYRRQIELERLERETPGITSVKWSDDYTIVIDDA